MLDSRLWPAALALALAAFLAAAVFASSQWSYRTAYDSQVSLTERGVARLSAARVLQRLTEAESAQRGYLLTGRTTYLTPYRDADADVARELEVLRRHHLHDPAVRATVQELTDRTREKLSELSTTIRLYGEGSRESWQALIDSDIGREKMAAARDAANRLLAYEDERIADERRVIYQVLERGRLAVQITSLLALVWFVFFLRKNRALQQAQQAHADDLRAQRDMLEKRVGERTAELRELNEHLQDVREVERSRLARVLHDDLGSLLTAAKLDVARLKRALPAGRSDADTRLAHLGSTIDDGVMLKRRIIDELSPSALHTLGLRTALEILVSDFRKRTDIPVTLEVDAQLPLADSPRIVVYRLVQECLDNTQRHARAGAGRVQVRQSDTHVLVEVIDDGVGFDPDAVPASSHGLRKLRHRVEALGGRFAVASLPGRGTEVQAQLPLEVSGWDAPAGTR